jgi:transcriptional regulator with XRE-family HTH domain
MIVNNGNFAATHFGRQMRKERLAHGWSLREFNERTGIDMGQASRIETGKQPPTEKVADACDRVFPERRGWFREYYEESKTWVPAGFRSWAEYEDKAATLRVWAPTIVHGLLETENYARIMLSVYPGVSDQVVKARLASRMERQRRVLFRADPPDVHVIVDEAALYRRVGSAEVMAEQMSHLLELAALDHVRPPGHARYRTSVQRIRNDHRRQCRIHRVAGWGRYVHRPGNGCQAEQAVRYACG